MPRRLSLYTAMELIRVIGLTAAVLAAVTAFGAVIKPLTGDAPLSAIQALKYVGLSMVPMIQYALPFAAGFGATIVFHRMASENEVMAMSVAGLRYRTILAPVMGLGIAFIILMIVLVHYWIPKTYALMGRIIAGDITAMLEHAVSEGVPVQFGDLEIWAEAISVEDEVEDGQADRRITLRRMLAARVGPRGGIESDVSAAAAVLDLYERDGIVLIRMAMDDAVSWEEAAGNLRGFPRIEPTHAIPVPMPERSEPMAMTRGELLSVSRDPGRYPPIAKMEVALADEVELQQQRDATDQALSHHGAVEFQAADHSGRVWRIQADELISGMLRAGPDSPVTIEEVDQEGIAQRRFFPDSAVLLTEVGGLDGRDRRVVLEMENVQVEDPPGAARRNQRSQVRIANLIPFQRSDAALEASHMRELAEDMAPQSAPVRRALNRITDAQDSLQTTVSSRLARRWAVAVTAGLLPLLGAVLALAMRQSQPLTIYILAFLPALLNLVLISGGSSFMRQGDVSGGLVVMWSGNVVLILITWACWWKVARH